MRVPDPDDPFKIVALAFTAVLALFAIAIIVVTVADMLRGCNCG